jgi:hypothetical protein
LSKTILLPCVNMGGALLKKSMQGLHPSFDAYNRGEKSRTKNKQRRTCQNDSAALREHGGAYYANDTFVSVSAMCYIVAQQAIIGTGLIIEVW